MRQQLQRVAVAAAAAGAALTATALRGARDIDEVAKSARRLGTDVGGFRALQLAAGEAGVSVSALTDNLQSIDREIASIGTSGQAARALGQLGLSVEEITSLDAPDRIAAIADRISEMGLSAGEATAVLRDLGVRNREMVLLMMQGGDAIRSARSDIEEYGLALDKVDSSRIEQARDAIGRLGLISQYAGQQLALQLVPAMGRLAETMTDSLREGGRLRQVIDTLAEQSSRMMAWIGAAVGAFAAYRVALVGVAAAKWAVAAASSGLRVALIRLGLPALIIGAGELAYQFSRLVEGAGSFGKAMSMLGDVAREVWDRIKMGGQSLGRAIRSVAEGIRAAFLHAFEWIVSKFAEITGTIADGVNNLFSGIGLDLGLTGMGNEAAEGLERARKIAELSARQLMVSSQTFARAARAPLESIQALRDTVDGVSEATEGASEAAGRFNAALGEIGDSGGGGSAGAAADGVRDLGDAAVQTHGLMDRLRDGMASAFASMITGAQSARQAIGQLLQSLAQMLANRAFQALLGGLFGGGGSFSFGGWAGPGSFPVPGFANGTPSAPKGMAWVGERGPELVNFRGGERVFDAQTSRRMGADNGVQQVFHIDARGAQEGVAQQIREALADAAPKIVNASVAEVGKRRKRGANI